MIFKRMIKSAVYKINENPLGKIVYKNSIAKRADLPLTDIAPLSRPISMFAPFTEEIHKPNDWYGHANNLKTYLGLPRSYQFKFIMEHGLYLNDQVEDLDIETDLPSMITYSTYRERILKKYRENVFSIGPFIHYAKSLLTEKEIIKEKMRLGKSVLFFPAHSTPVIGMEFDTAKLCRQIKKISKGFDNVRICLYWKDILLGRQRIYADFGFECVTAGHMLDPLFLPRLKSLILTSNFTASNIISSHVGFCVYLGKPHVVLEEKLNMKTTQFWKKRITDGFESEGYLEVLEEFTKLNYKISKKQTELMEKYWGTDKVRTKAQLKRIIDISEKIYQNKKHAS